MIKKFILTIAILSMANMFSVKAEDDQLKWEYLRQEIIRKPLKTGIFHGSAFFVGSLFSQAMLLIFGKIKLGPLPVSLLILAPALTVILVRAAKSKQNFKQLLQNWSEESQNNIPAECHEQFNRLSTLLKNDPSEFEKIFVVELHNLQLAISKHTGAPVFI